MNLRPLEPHSSALPDCATSRREDVDRRRQQACQQKHPVFLQTAPPAPWAEKGKNRVTVCALRPSARYGRSAGTSRPQPCPAALPYPLDGWRAQGGLRHPAAYTASGPATAGCHVRKAIDPAGSGMPSAPPCARHPHGHDPGARHRTRGKAWAFCPAKQKRDLRFRRSLGVSVFWSG